MKKRLFFNFQSNVSNNTVNRIAVLLCFEIGLNDKMDNFKLFKSVQLKTSNLVDVFQKLIKIFLYFNQKSRFSAQQKFLEP